MRAQFENQKISGLVMHWRDFKDRVFKGEIKRRGDKVKFMDSSLDEMDGMLKGLRARLDKRMDAVANGTYDSGTMKLDKASEKLVEAIKQYTQDMRDKCSEWKNKFTTTKAQVRDINNLEDKLRKTEDKVNDVLKDIELLNRSYAPPSTDFKPK
jgi:gas vesicle protein